MADGVIGSRADLGSAMISRYVNRMMKQRVRKPGTTKFRSQAKLARSGLTKAKARRLTAAGLVFPKGGVSSDRVKGSAMVGRFGNPRARAADVGAQPGIRLPIARAREVIRQIVSEATDLFQNVDDAEAYLGGDNFAGSGKNALDLVRSGGAATVIGRLDELRFGPQG